MDKKSHYTLMLILYTNEFGDRSSLLLCSAIHLKNFRVMKYQTGGEGMGVCVCLGSKSNKNQQNIEKHV